MPHTNNRATRVCAAAALFISAAAAIAQPQSAPRGTLILGEIETITVHDVRDPSSSGTIVVSGEEIAIPANLLIGLPKRRLAIRDLVLEGPERCTSLKPPQSGLALSDTCRNDNPPALARVVAHRTSSGDLVASVVMVQKDSAQTLARIKPQHPRATRRGLGGYPPQPQNVTQPVKPPV